MTDERLYTEAEVRELLRAACATRPSIAAWARDHEQDASFLSEMLSGHKPISKRICKALGLRKRTMFEIDRGNHAV